MAILGRENAINLGVNYDRLVMNVLVLSAVLISTSTALVGPITFFGLIVANLSYHLFTTYKHSVLISRIRKGKARIKQKQQRFFHCNLAADCPLASESYPFTMWVEDCVLLPAGMNGEGCSRTCAVSSTLQNFTSLGSPGSWSRLIRTNFGWRAQFILPNMCHGNNIA